MEIRRSLSLNQMKGESVSAVNFGASTVLVCKERHGIGHRTDTGDQVEVPAKQT
jgi:hypothetical protein